MFKKLSTLFKKANIITHIIELQIPDEVRQEGRKHPILHNVGNNRAVGEIRLFIFRKENILQVGQPLTLVDKDYECTWIHLGQNYFKLVKKA